MGANNSIPRTAEFLNPSVEDEVVTVTQQVSNRIEDLRKQEQVSEGKQNRKSYTCKNCGKEKEVQTSALPPKTPEEIERNEYEAKLRQMEKDAFEEAYEKVETTLRKPMNWGHEHNQVQLKALESDLLKCYTEYHGEPLRCHSNAKDYQKFVFHNQYQQLIMNHLKGAGDNANQEEIQNST